MNDDELISRLENMLPEELTPEELALLRQRAAVSPAVRDALARWLQFEQVMAAGLSRYRLPIDLVLAKAAAASSPAGGMLSRLLGWGLAGTALVVLSVSLYLVAREQRPVPPVAAARSEPAGPPERRQAEAQGMPRRAGRQRPPPSNAIAADAGARGRPTALRPPEEALEASPSDLPPHGLPPDQQRANPAPAPASKQPLATALFRIDDGIHGFANLAAQLEVQQGRVQPAPEGPDGGLWLDGTAHWKAAWPAGHVLRLWLVEHHGLELRLEGTPGLVVRYYEFPEPAWAAYQVAAESDGAALRGAAPRSRMVLRALDDGRVLRTGQGPIDLVWRAGRLEMLRADVLLLSVPLEHPPTGLALAGNAKLRRAHVLPAAETLQEYHPLSAAALHAPAATFDWQATPQAELRTAAEGRIELAGNAAINRASVLVEQPGLSVLTFEIEAPQAGTGIYVADAAGRPVWHLGFFAGPHSGALVCAAAAHPEMVPVHPADPAMLPTALVGERVWLRVVPATAGWKSYLSSDGRWWSRIPQVALPAEAAFARAGIYALPERVIRLTSLQIQPLDVLLALAPAAAYDQAPALGDVADWAAWQARVFESLPSGCDAGDWQAACALKSLAGGAAPALVPQLLTGLAERVAALGPPAALRVQQLHALALLCRDGDVETAGRLAQAYERLAATLALRGERLSPATWRAICVTAPIPGLDLLHEPLWRTAALAFAARGETEAFDSLVAQAAYFAALLGRPTPLAATTGAGMHPLVDRPGREEVNLLAELEGALQLGAYRDACQIISSSTPQHSGGLLPDSAEQVLRVSLAAAVANAMEQHPELRAAMRRHFGQVARLRVRRALAEEDEAAAEAATVQFYGTDAAAAAHTWLGDRALAAGQFERARSHYRAALAQAEGQARAVAAAMLRLTAALQGRDEGEPPPNPITYAGQKLSPAEFEALVAELRAAHAGAGADPAQRAAMQAGGAATPGTALSPEQAALPAMLAPGRQHAVQKAVHIDRLPAAAATWFGGTGGEPVPRAKLACAGMRLLCDGPHLVLCTPETLYLLDGGGRPQWSASISNGLDAGGLLGPPLELGSGLCLARVRDGGAELVLLDAASGQELWRTNTSGNVCSNAIWAEQALRCLVQRPTPDGWLEICLAAFDPRTGALTGVEPLLQLERELLERVWGALHQAADRLVALIEGCGLCCDIAGRVIWLRRQPWPPPAWRREAAGSRLLASASQVWLACPAAHTLESCRLDTGRLEWQQQLPEPFEMIGLAGEVLVLRGAKSLYGLDRRDGRLLWHTRVRDAGAAIWCEGAYVVAVIAQELAGGRTRPALQWIEAATGLGAACVPINGLPAAQAGTVRLGRVCRWQQRLWVPFAAMEAGELGIAEVVPLAEVSPLAAAHRWALPHVAGSRLAETVADVLPGWQWIDGPEDGSTGIVAELHGQQNVLVTLAEPLRPTRMAARALVPRSQSCRLKIEWSQPLPARWRLVVRAWGETLWEQTFDPAGGGWQRLTVDLSRFAGNELPLLLEQQALEAGAAYVAWKACRIVEGE